MNEMVKVVSADGRRMVELPDGYGFDTDEVFVRRDGGRLVLETADDAIDPETGLTIARLRALIQEGLEGPDEPRDVDAIKRDLRAALAAERSAR